MNPIIIWFQFKLSIIIYIIALLEILSFYILVNIYLILFIYTYDMKIKD